MNGRRSFLKGIAAAFAGGAAAPAVVAAGKELDPELLAELRTSTPPTMELRKTFGESRESIRLRAGRLLIQLDALEPIMQFSGQVDPQWVAARTPVWPRTCGKIVEERNPGSVSILKVELDDFVPLDVGARYRVSAAFLNGESFVWEEATVVSVFLHPDVTKVIFHVKRQLGRQPSF